MIFYVILPSLRVSIFLAGSVRISLVVKFGDTRDFETNKIFLLSNYSLCLIGNKMVSMTPFYNDNGVTIF